MKKLLLSLVLVACCNKPYDPRVVYSDCLDDRMSEFKKGDGQKYREVTVEFLQQAQSACAPIIDYKEPVPPVKQ